MTPDEERVAWTRGRESALHLFFGLQAFDATDPLILGGADTGNRIFTLMEQAKGPQPLEQRLPELVRLLLENCLYNHVELVPMRELLNLLNDIDCAEGYSVADRDLPKLWRALAIARQWRFM